jgi:hypothetical protein
MNEALPRARHVQWLVGPLVTFAAVVALLGAARLYDRLPAKLPPCGLRTLTGVPCVGCGGTRAMRALAEGRLVEALRFNPAAVLGVFAVAAWVLLAWARYRGGVEPPPFPEQNRRISRNVLAVGFLLLLNWGYLILFLPSP